MSGVFKVVSSSYGSVQFNFVLSYACRKNVRRHRISNHNITEEQADSNAAKRVKVKADTGFILTPGFERENAILKQRSSTESVKPTVVRMTGQPKKRNST